MKKLMWAVATVACILVANSAEAQTQRRQTGQSRLTVVTDVTAPAGMDVERYPILRARGNKSQIEAACRAFGKQLGLVEVKLAEVWSGFNYSQEKKFFFSDELPAGTMVMATPDGRPVYKLDCCNLLWQPAPAPVQTSQLLTLIIPGQKGEKGDKGEPGKNGEPGKPGETRIIREVVAAPAPPLPPPPTAPAPSPWIITVQGTVGTWCSKPFMNGVAAALADADEACFEGRTFSGGVGRRFGQSKSFWWGGGFVSALEDNSYSVRDLDGPNEFVAVARNANEKGVEGGVFLRTKHRVAPSVAASAGWAWVGGGAETYCTAPGCIPQPGEAKDIFGHSSHLAWKVAPGIAVDLGKARKVTIVGGIAFTHLGFTGCKGADVRLNIGW